MIALQKEKIADYNAWLNNTKDQLNEHFENYLHKKKKDWITQANREKIQSFLFATSFGKCAYCERKPNDGGGYLEIEHIVPKSKNKNLVFSFENLLPSCKQCNTIKGNKDSNGILNPYNEKSFKVHLELDFQTMKISGLSENGKKTIDILNLSLNAKDFRLDEKYFKGAIHYRVKIKEDIDKALIIKKKHKENQTIDCLFDEIVALLERIDVKSANTSTYATYLLNNQTFNELIDFVKSKDEGKFLEIDKLLKEKSKYSIAIKFK
jgi:uncharacterized protein (TIGR02646 family)